jgi:hypothetical protein
MSNVHFSSGAHSADIAGAINGIKHPQQVQIEIIDMHISNIL